MGTYNGDPTNAQSPDIVPQADGVPTVNLVVDGTGDNAATVNQQFKSAANWNAWAAAPRSVAAAGAVLSNWAKQVLGYRNALGQRRHMVDHHGFPAGQILAIDEDWSDGSWLVSGGDPATDPPSFAVSSSGQFATRWNYRIVNSSAQAAILLPASANAAANSNPYPSSRLYMQVPVVGGPVVTVISVERVFAPIVMETSGGTAITMHWDHSSNLIGLNNTSAGQVAMGLSVPGITGGSTGLYGVSGAGALNPVSVAFVGGQGTGSGVNNWKACVNYNGTSTLYDTGIDCNTPNVRRRFRIEVIGAAASDDATSRVHFWLDGGLVKSVAVDMANGGTGVALGPFFRLWGEGAAVGASFGPVRVRANLWPGDVFI